MHQRRPFFEPNPVQVPQRFGMGVMFVATVLFAVLYLVLKSTRVPPPFTAAISFFALVVATAQSLWGARFGPREVSGVVGMVYVPLAAVAATWATYPNETQGIICGTPCLVVLGALLGYCCGAFVAGPFLLKQSRQDETTAEPFK